MHTSFHVLRFVWYTLVGVGVLFGVGLRPVVVRALGMSPPTVTIDAALDADDSVSSSVTILRAFGEEGAITMLVEFDGDCPACVNGADYLILPSGEREVTYPFTVSAAGKTTGTYTSKIRFLRYTESAGGSGAYTTIQSGVTLVVYFSVVNDAATSSSGSGAGSVSSEGSSGSGGSTSSDKDDKKSDADKQSGSTEGSRGDGDAKTEGVSVGEDDTTGETSEDEASEESTHDAVTELAPISVISTDGGAVVAQPVTSRTDTVVGDAAVSLRSFLRDGCAACDANDDDVVTFTDIVLAYVFGGLGGEVVGTPPFASGPPMAEDAVVLSLALGEMTGAYAFRSAATTDSEGDMMTVYVTLGTGPSGAYAVDTTVTFDTDTLTFAGMTTDGSVLANVDADRTGVEDGTLRLAGVDDDAFVGTNGYLATLYFTPRTQGAVRIVLEYADVYQPYSNVMAPLALESLVGSVVDAQTVEAAAATPEAAPADAMEDDVRTQWWFSTLWIILLALAALLVCVMCALLIHLDRKMYAKR